MSCMSYNISGDRRVDIAIVWVHIQCCLLCESRPCCLRVDVDECNAGDLEGCDGSPMNKCRRLGERGVTLVRDVRLLGDRVQGAFGIDINDLVAI